MDIQHEPVDNNIPVAPESQPQSSSRRSLWRQYRWLVIGLLIVTVIGGGVGLWLSKGKHQPASATQSLKTVTQNATSSSPSTQPDNTNGNHWQGSIDPAVIPLGDGHVSMVPAIGSIDSCVTSFHGGGARRDGNWINETNKTWNAETKVAVAGSVYWPAADYSETVSGNNRILATNDLPETYPTGIFPIGRTDPAYQYDANPNHISAQRLSYSLPLNPVTASAVGCLPMGPIGILSDGVVLFNALDDAGRDAVAHETQDACDGHPNLQEMYHYHNVPSCLRDKARSSSTLVGYAFDGFGIYVERDDKGNLPTNTDLDACHGRSSLVMWNGKQTDIYHYDATLEYPYTIGCYHGMSAVGRGGPL